MNGAVPTAIIVAGLALAGYALLMTALNRRMGIGLLAALGVLEILLLVLVGLIVAKLVEEKWNLPALTRRDAAATSPLGALDLTAPPSLLTPPELPAPALAWGTW